MGSDVYGATLFFISFFLSNEKIDRVCVTAIKNYKRSLSVS